MTTFERSRSLMTMVPAAGHARMWRARRASRTRWAAIHLALTIMAIMLLAAVISGCAAEPRIVEYDYESANGRHMQRPGASSRHESLAPAQPSNSRGRVPVDLPGQPQPVTFNIPDEPAPSDSTTPETQRLAELTQRDVDLILNARDNGGWNRTSDNSTAQSGAAPSTTLGGATGIDGTASPSQGAAVPAPRRVVQWNDSSTPVTSINSSSSASASGAPATGASVLGANVEEPSPTAPVQSPAQPQQTTGDLTEDAAGAETNAAPVETDVVILPRPDRIRQLMVDLSRELYAEGAYSEHPLRELAVIAAMNLHHDDRPLDPAAIPDLTDEERELLANLQTFFRSVGETLDRGSELPAGIAEAAAALRQSLVHEPVLTLPRIALCTRVGGFGDYTPFTSSVFLAASDQKAIVYLEIAGFVSEINHNDEFVTELSQQLTIYSERDGIPVWKEDWLSAVDVSRNKRQDFFTTQIIALPKALSVGRYTLKVRVRDEKSKAESETSVTFEIVADPKMVQ